MTVLRTATTAALTIGTVAAAVVTAQPAQAATRTECATVGGSRVCVGVQTTSSDVRGYASITDPDRDDVVTVRSLVLQRRTCGGAWRDWTSVRTTNDGSRSQDVDVTTYVIFPDRVQFRSVMTFSIEGTTGATPPAYGGTKTSRAYGAC